MTKPNQASKLVHVLRNDALGGVEHSTLEVAHYFASQGIQQQVIILSPLSGGISEKFVIEKIPVTSIPFTKAKLISFIFSYFIYLRKFKPEVQLVSGAFGLHAILAIIARFSGVKRCWTYLIMGPATKGLPKFVQYLMGKIALKFSSGELSITEYLKTEFHKSMGLPLKRMHVVYRWRDIENIATKSNSARKIKNTSSPIILTISRLDWVKDLPNLIIAFSIFVESEPESLFYIVGEGPMRKQLEDQVAMGGLVGKVVFLGHRHDVADLLGSSDIFIFSTSPTEGLGSVMIEAMAAGTPMICTDVGPCREVMGNGAGGVLVPAGDHEVLAQAMLALWRDPIKRQKLALQAHEFARHRYTKEVCGQQLMTLLFPAR
jgi:glycosyltransferase involved in cell wall biosynthesis